MAVVAAISVLASWIFFQNFGPSVSETSSADVITKESPPSLEASSDMAVPTPETSNDSVVCPDPTLIALVAGTSGNIEFEGGTLHPDSGEVMSKAGNADCDSGTCLTLTQQNRTLAGPSVSSDLVFFFTQPVAALSFDLCGADVPLQVHGYVDTPGALEDETFTLNASGDAACTSQELTFDPDVHRVTIKGNNADLDQTWGVENISITWPCQ